MLISQVSHALLMGQQYDSLYLQTSIDVLPSKNQVLCKYFKHVGNK